MTKFSTPYPTLSELVDAFPTGAWAGDDRLTQELEHFNFVESVIRRVVYSTMNSDYKEAAERFGAKKHSEMIQNAEYINEVAQLTPAGQRNLMFQMHAASSDGTTIYADASNPMALMSAVMAMKSDDAAGLEGAGAKPGFSIATEMHRALAHVMVAAAIMRAHPGVPFLSHYLNWSIIKGRTVYIASYNIYHDGECESYDAAGNVLADEDKYASVRRDPRIEQPPKRKRPIGEEDLSDADLVYQV